jgi:heme/copper-type cytochrome/quinol oxidase subunit 4
MQLSRIRAAVVGLLVAAATVIAWGGYGHHWPWTGINGHTATLWDWLHLLLLPIAVSVLPIWLSRRAHLTPRHHAVLLGTVMAFAVITVAGYLVPWEWTGFTGNTLWDWLELLALPLAVALTPVVLELQGSWSTRHTVVAIAVLVALVVVVFGGYLGNWSWTGFRGNTLWDWLHLLLLPLLLPAIVAPALGRMAAARVLVDEARITAQ